jgi:serine/threonine-protein kinase
MPPSDLFRAAIRGTSRALSSDMSATKYVLTELAGMGGMGMIHRALSEGQPGQFAVKQLRPELVDHPVMIRRFQTELRVGRMLEHPSITRVIDDGTTSGGAPFFVMPWAEGESLARRLAARGSLPVPEAVAIVTRLLDALAFAHEQGIVHGDVKTDNVLVAGDGEAVKLTLLDWGLARFLAEPAAISTDFVAGTPGYMAPEVMRGAPPSIASDLYSAGVIFYELLTGTWPFGSGTGAEITQRQLSGTIEPPSTRVRDPALVAPLDPVVLRALANEPADRYASAWDLEAAIAMPSINMRAQTEDLPPQRPPRRRGAHGTRPPAVDDDDAIASTYLTRAAGQLSAHHLEEAARHLQLAVDRLTRRSCSSKALWPVLLSLAAVRDGLGDRAAALRLAHDARAHATRAHAELGAKRAEALLRRLSH